MATPDSDVESDFTDLSSRTPTEMGDDASHTPTEGGEQVNAVDTPPERSVTELSISPSDSDQVNKETPLETFKNLREESHAYIVNKQFETSLIANRSSEAALHKVADEQVQRLERIDSLVSALPESMRVPSITESVIQVWGDRSWNTPDLQPSEDVTKRSFKYLTLSERAHATILNLGRLHWLTRMSKSYITLVSEAVHDHVQKMYLADVAAFEKGSPLWEGDRFSVDLEDSLDNRYENSVQLVKGLVSHVEDILPAKPGQKGDLAPLLQQQRTTCKAWLRSIGAPFELTDEFPGLVWDTWTKFDRSVTSARVPVSRAERVAGALEHDVPIDHADKRQRLCDNGTDAVRLMEMAIGLSTSWD